MTEEMIMDIARTQAAHTMRKDEGGPFGAVVTKINDEGKEQIIAISSNTVLKDNDPTAHAEMNAIRSASKRLGTYNLKGCRIYATGYPCPMCMAAIMWSNIGEIYVSGEREDAAAIGFRDDAMYEVLKDPDNSFLEIKRVNRDIARDLYGEYEYNKKQMY